MFRPSILRESHRVTFRSKVAVLAVVALLAGACGTKDADGPLEPTGPTGRVRLVNLITDPADNPVNATLEGLVFTVNLAYTQSAPANLGAPSTAPYAAVLTGDRTFVLTRTADPNATVATLPFTIASGQDLSVYAVGGTTAAPVTSFITTDDNTVAPGAQTRLRAVHMSPTAGPLDIFITTPTADLATATPTWEDVTYRVPSAYVLMAPGTYRIRAVPANTLPANRAANVIVTTLGTTAVPDFALTAGRGWTIGIADKPDEGAPYRAFLLNDR
jgi:hypothetical protein